MNINKYWCSRKVPLFLSDFKETWIFSTVFVWNISHSKMYIGLHVKYRYSCQILTKLEFYGQIFEIYTSIKFHENPSTGNRVVPCGQTDRMRSDEATVAFRNPKAPIKTTAVIWNLKLPRRQRTRLWLPPFGRHNIERREEHEGTAHCTTWCRNAEYQNIKQIQWRWLPLRHHIHNEF